jgi:membrane peptidoglycan carboxypeptidase
MAREKILEDVQELPPVARLEVGIPDEIPRLTVREKVFGTMNAMHWQRTLKRRVRQMKAYSSNKSWWRSQFTRSKVMRNVVLGMVFVFAGGLLSFFILFAWFAKDLPQPDKIVRREGFSTKLLDRNGDTLYEVFVDQQRTPVTLDQIPENLRLATIAIEDKNFYQHSGFDVQGYARIVWNVVVRRRLIGGSTLTQQLVKNVLLTNERSLTRKMKEFILAVQIENKYSKDEILQMYLNEAPYGGTAWGVGTAAQAYFNKEVSDLNLTESAILAGMPQLPSVYSPFSGNPTAYIGRTEAVLRRMREDGYIDKEMEASVAGQLATVEFSRGLVGIKAPHFSLHVKKLLEEMYGESLVANGGLKVTTSLDLPMHEKAQEIVTEEIEKVADAGIGNGAALVMDPNGRSVVDGGE